MQGGQNVQWQKLKLRFPVVDPGELFGEVSGLDVAEGYRSQPAARSFAFVLAVQFAQKLVTASGEQVM